MKALIGSMLLLVGCPKDAPAPAAGASPVAPPVCSPMVSTPSGLQYCDVTVGQGMIPAPGLNVVVHYTGWLASGEKFDSSLDRGEPLVFPLGMGVVIPGWDEGLSTMSIGGQRVLRIPAKLGYGERDMGVIPPNSELVFDVQLLGVQ